MDQGLAAVLGATVGALATGGGSYVTALYAKKAQKKEARREVYRAFLSELSEIQAQMQKLRDLIFYGPRGEADTDSINAGLAEVAHGVSRLRGLEIGVRLEGPDSVSTPAREVTQAMAWMWARMKFIRSNTLDEDEYWNMMETIEADFFTFEEKVNYLHQEAPRHL